MIATEGPKIVTVDVRNLIAVVVGMIENEGLKLMSEFSELCGGAGEQRIWGEK